jgi:hypothetical protein
MNVKQDLAEKLNIIGDSIEKMCEKNLETSVQFKRYDIAKIWELIKFVTFNNNIIGSNLNDNSDNYYKLFKTNFFGQDRPWSCSMFGRSLVNSLIDNCVLVNDYQTAALIIAILKQYDEKMKSNISKLTLTNLKEYQVNELMDHFENMRCKFISYLALKSIIIIIILFIKIF